MKLKNNKSISVLLFLIYFLSWQINTNAEVRPEILFDAYLTDGGVNIDKFTDSIMSGEIEIEDENTIHFLETFPDYFIKLLRNTIFAKKGYIFENKELQNYFKNKPWYEPKEGGVVLSAKEEKIISLIKKIENCDNVKFDDFYKLFPSIGLPFTYCYDVENCHSSYNKTNHIKTIFVRKFLGAGKYNYWLKFDAIGELYKNNKFIVLIYQLDSQGLEIQPRIATFTLDGKLISDKGFISFGGDITSYTVGKLFIDKFLTIRAEERDLYDGSRGKTIKHKKYFIDSLGIIK